MFKRSSTAAVTSKQRTNLVTHLTSHLAWLLAWITIAAALSLAAAQMTAAKAAEVQLQAGKLKATVEIATPDTTHASGSSIFADIELRTSRRRDEARFDLTVSGGEIVKITGRRIEVSGTGATRAITALRLRRNRPRYIKAEIFLGERDPPGEESGRSTAGDRSRPDPRAKARITSTTLRMTLRDPESDASDSQVASWQLSNCAREYHDGLSAIRHRTLNRMLAAQAILRTKDGSLPGTWLFSNRRLKRARSQLGNGRPSICRAYVRRAGRRRCAKWSRPGSAMALPPEPTRSERKVLDFLAEFMQRRGYAPEFGDNGRYRWLTYRVSNDLNNYLKQPPHAALCTGIEQLLTFHKRNMRPFKSRAEKVRALVKTARALAKTRVEAVFKLVAVKKRLQAELRAIALEQRRTAEQAAAETLTSETLTSETLASKTLASKTPPSLVTPAAAAKTPKSKTPASKPAALLPAAAPVDVKPVPQAHIDMITELAALVLPPDRRFGIKVETKPFAALQSMVRELSARETLPVQSSALPQTAQESSPEISPHSWNDKDIMAAAIAALRIIEAGVYADLLQSRYAGITNGIDDTILAIGTAGRQSCTCQ